MQPVIQKNLFALTNGRSGYHCVRVLSEEGDSTLGMHTVVEQLELRNQCSHRGYAVVAISIVCISRLHNCNIFDDILKSYSLSNLAGRTAFLLSFPDTAANASTPGTSCCMLFSLVLGGILLAHALTQKGLYFFVSRKVLSFLLLNPANQLLVLQPVQLLLRPADQIVIVCGQLTEVAFHILVGAGHLALVFQVG